MEHGVVVGFLLVMLAAITSSQDPCSPCLCIRHVISCRNATLGNVPSSTFRRLPNAKTFEVLDLAYNNISSLSYDAFANLAVHSILLNNNRLISINLNAFQSLRGNLTELVLSDNDLNTIPTALGKLDILTKLDIRNNPIDGTEFDDKTFQSLGDTLKEFHFGSPSIRQWPVALTHFPKLETLDLDGSEILWLPITAFHGYEYTLKNLTIRNTKMYQIPQAISTLRNLDTLHFDNNIAVGDHGILASAFTSDNSRDSPIKHLTLINDSLSTMPSVLRKLSHLQSLALDHNKMWYISDTAVANIISHDLVSLSLQACHLDRIPHSLLRLRSVQSLNLAGNNIHSIEVDDINYQSGLVSLNLGRNPIEYVSENAFKGLTHLNKINFSGSKIKQMPHALSNVKDSLGVINLEGCDIECNCDLAWFLGKLDMQRTSILGDCETIEKGINDYMLHRVPTCPT